MLASNTIKIQLLSLILLSGSLFGLLTHELTSTHVGLIIFGYFLYGCLGIVVTFHRYLSHKSYSTYSIIPKIFSILGCLGGTGSPIAWVAIHINHHLKSDKPEDPHSPKHKGLKIFLLNYEQQIDPSTKWRIRSLITDNYQQMLHRYYFLIFFSWSLILFVLGGVELMLFLHWIPAVITIIMSNVVNYVGHKPSSQGGSRRYNLSDQSTNNWLWAIPSWGESWHNNHHRHPKNYSLGEKWWEVDISAMVIRLSP